MTVPVLAAGRWPTNADLGPRIPRNGFVCLIGGCNRPRKARGWCNPHYRRWQRHGDPLLGDPPRSRELQACEIRDCGRPRHSRGWCNLHYGRWKRHGDPLALKQAAHGSGWINGSGYRAIKRGNRNLLEHRVVMEQKLGRPLRGDENVHHINGVRHDNRPENLELRQPPGQRVDDLIPWAIELLERYAPDILAGGRGA